MNTPGDNGDIGGDMGGAVVLEARVAAQDPCQAAACAVCMLQLQKQKWAGFLAVSIRRKKKSLRAQTKTWKTRELFWKKIQNKQDRKEIMKFLKQLDEKRNNKNTEKTEEYDLKTSRHFCKNASQIEK